MVQLLEGTTAATGSLNLGMKDENLRLRDHDPAELATYSNATTDFEYLFPFGWGELWGVASRTNYDLTHTRSTPGRISPTLTRRTTSTMSPTLWSRISAPTE